MRGPKETTYEISMDAYAMILNCCEKYYDNLAWKYPDTCNYCHSNLSLDRKIFDIALENEIPNLFRKEGCVVAPSRRYNVFDRKTKYDSYDQYSLLDLIEFIALYCNNYEKYYDNECEHSYLVFNNLNTAFLSFKKEINDIFELMGILYILTDKKQVERIIQNSPITKEVENSINTIQENETKKLLCEAIDLHRSHYPEAPRDAAEKIWDAFERLKTYYTSLDKKKSAEKIVNDMSNNEQPFADLFDAEFKALTDIGNKYRIRHHETDKIDVTDYKHYDYFFNRCLSLIALAIQYLK